MHRLEEEYEQALERVRGIRRVIDVIKAIPADQRQAVVFEAMALLENGDDAFGRSAAPRRGRPTASTRRGKGKRRGPRLGGPYDRIVTTLKANRGMPIPELTKAVYGNNEDATMKRTRAALNSLKGKSVRKISGQRGGWEAI